MDWLYATNERNCLEEIQEYVQTVRKSKKGPVFGRRDMLQVLRRCFVQRGLIKEIDVLKMLDYMPKHWTNVHGFIKVMSIALETARNKQYIQNFAFDCAAQ